MNASGITPAPQDTPEGGDHTRQEIPAHTGSQAPSTQAHTEPTDPVSVIQPEVDDRGQPVDASAPAALEQTIRAGSGDQVPDQNASSEDSAAAPATDEPSDSSQPAWVRPGDARIGVVESGVFRGRVSVNEPGAIGLETVNRLAKRPRRLAATALRHDVALDSGTIGELRFACASSRGLAHYNYRTVREDAYALGTSPDDEWLIAVIADGVGGSFFPDFAADEAVKKGYNATIRALASCDDGHLRSVTWADVVEAMRLSVEERARDLLPASTSEEERLGATTRSLTDVAATTADIIGVRTRPDEDGTFEFMRLGVAGDGSALILDAEKGWKLVAAGKQASGGLVSNAVVPLPLDPGMPRPLFGRLEPGQALLCCTDGYGDPLADGDTSVGRYFLEALSTPLDGPEFLSRVSYVNRAADDDRTILVVWSPSCD